MKLGPASPRFEAHERSAVRGAARGTRLLAVGFVMNLALGIFSSWMLMLLLQEGSAFESPNEFVESLQSFWGYAGQWLYYVPVAVLVFGLLRIRAADAGLRGPANAALALTAVAALASLLQWATWNVEGFRLSREIGQWIGYGTAGAYFLSEVLIIMVLTRLGQLRPGRLPAGFLPIALVLLVLVFALPWSGLLPDPSTGWAWFGARVLKNAAFAAWVVFGCLRLAPALEEGAPGQAPDEPLEDWEEVPASPARDLWVGAAWAVGGIALTLGSQGAEGGVVFYGAIIYGVFRMGLGLARMA